MRRDNSCMKDIEPSVIKDAIGGCAQTVSFDWQNLTTQAFELQRKFFAKLLFHPAPERYFFSSRSLSTETASNLVYRMVDEMQKVVAGAANSTSMARVERELEDLRLESFRKDQRIESMVKLIAELRRG